MRTWIAAVYALAGAIATPPAQAAEPLPSRPTARLRAPYTVHPTPYTLDRRDLFFCDGATGAVLLGWRGIRWGSEQVTLDGRPLAAVIDYELDDRTGVLRLRRPAPPGAVLEVAYAVLPFLAAPNDPTDPPPPAPTLTLIRSLLLNREPRALAPDFSPLPSTPYTLHPTPYARHPLRLETLAGLRFTELADEMAGAAGGAARVAYFRADPWFPTAAPEAREQFESSLDVRTGRASRVLVDSAFARDSLFSASYEEAVRQRVRFETTFGKSTTALMWEHAQVSGRRPGSASDAFTAQVSHPFSRTLGGEALASYRNSLYGGREGEALVTLRQLLGRSFEAQVGAQVRRSLFAGDALDTALTLNAQVLRRTTAQAAYRQSDSTVYGRARRLSTTLATELGSAVQVQGEASHSESLRGGESRTLGLGMAVRPSRGTVLETALRESLGEKTGEAQSQSVRLTHDPSAAFQLQLGYDRLDSAQDGQATNGLWMLTVGGKRYVKVEGYSGVHAAPESGAYQDSLYRLEARPIEELALSGSLRRVLGEEAARELGGLGANLTLLQRLELAAAYRRPTIADPLNPNLYGGDVRLSLAPVSGFKLIGQYVLRPEDERGALLEQRLRSLGLETRLGSFALQGSVGVAEGLAVPRPGQQVDLLATVALGGRTKLYGGVRIQDPGLPADGSAAPGGHPAPRSRVYRVGVSRSSGGSLFVLLEAQLGWLLDAAGQRTLNPKEARAQARVGLRF